MEAVISIAFHNKELEPYDMNKLEKSVSKEQMYMSQAWKC